MSQITDRQVNGLPKLLGVARRNPVRTPDARYVIVRGVLWRAHNPALDEQTRSELVARLMAARRRLARKPLASKIERAARKEVHLTKTLLGERGDVWWHDGAPDYTRRKVENTPYAQWYSSLCLPDSDD